MSGIKLTKKDALMILLLIVILIGTVYYMAFYTPFQNELSRIRMQFSELDTEIMTAQQKVASMDGMQSELDEIFARPASEITEIAPYNNAKNIMNFLDGILGENYEMSSPDPKIGDDGTVRRNINLSFTCADYASAKAILNSLASWNYRCLLQNITISGEEAGVADGAVTVSATMTFFESTNIT